MKRKQAAAQVRPIVRDLAQKARHGRMDRREFLALATTLGAPAFAEHGLIGLLAPTAAQA